jgi:hypothetical protein
MPRRKSALTSSRRIGADGLRNIKSPKTYAAVAQSTTRRRSPQCNGELMAEKQILGAKPASRLEQIDE